MENANDVEWEENWCGSLHYALWKYRYMAEAYIGAHVFALKVWAEKNMLKHQWRNNY